MNLSARTTDTSTQIICRPCNTKGASKYRMRDKTITHSPTLCRPVNLVHYAMAVPREEKKQPLS